MMINFALIYFVDLPLEHFDTHPYLRRIRILLPISEWGQIFDYDSNLIVDLPSHIVHVLNLLFHPL